MAGLPDRNHGAGSRVPALGPRQPSAPARRDRGLSFASPLPLRRHIQLPPLANHRQIRRVRALRGTHHAVTDGMRRQGGRRFQDAEDQDLPRDIRGGGATYPADVRRPAAPRRQRLARPAGRPPLGGVRARSTSRGIRRTTLARRPSWLRLARPRQSRPRRIVPDSGRRRLGRHHRSQAAARRRLGRAASLAGRTSGENRLLLVLRNRDRPARSAVARRPGPCGRRRRVRHLGPLRSGRTRPSRRRTVCQRLARP